MLPILPSFMPPTRSSIGYSSYPEFPQLCFSLVDKHCSLFLATILCSLPPKSEAAVCHTMAPHSLAVPTPLTDGVHYLCAMPEFDSPELKTEIVTELPSKLLLALPCDIYPSDPLFHINPPLLCCHQVDFVLVWFSVLLPRQFFPSLSPTDALAGCCLCTGHVHH